MRVEVLEGAERRRRWSFEDKLRIVEASYEAGVSVCSVARRHGMLGRLRGIAVDAARPDEAASLLGVWRDPWFGEVALCPRADGIGFASVRSPLMAGRVMRLADGRWLVDWDDEGVDAEAWLHPPSRGQGDGATLTLSHVDPDADFSYDYADLAFTRVRDCP